MLGNTGKTVLLKCLLGLHNYDKGEIIFDKINYKNISDKEKIGLKSKIGTVFQGSALFDSMNIEGNVMLPLKMFNNYSNNEMLDIVNQVLKRVNLENVNKKYNKILSQLRYTGIEIGMASKRDMGIK